MLAAIRWPGHGLAVQAVARCCLRYPVHTTGCARKASQKCVPWVLDPVGRMPTTTPRNLISLAVAGLLLVLVGRVITYERTGAGSSTSSRVKRGRPRESAGVGAPAEAGAPGDS